MKKLLFLLVLLFSISKLVKLFTSEWYPARHWAYLKYVLRHKYFVFEECIKLGIPLHIAILHDWDKFLPDEWMPYSYFFNEIDGSKRQVRSKEGYYKPTDTGDLAFDTAWLSHARFNKHHWQYWVLSTEADEKIFEMPLLYTREMLADWKGAGRAQGTPDTLVWYTANRSKMKLHPKTRAWIEEQIGYIDNGDS